MRTEQAGARAERPQLIWRVIERLRPGPAKCVFCPGDAADSWFMDPFGKVNGMCPHCLERAAAAGDRGRA